MVGGKAPLFSVILQTDLPHSNSASKNPLPWGWRVSGLPVQSEGQGEKGKLGSDLKSDAYR